MNNSWQNPRGKKKKRAKCDFPFAWTLHPWKILMLHLNRVGDSLGLMWPGAGVSAVFVFAVNRPFPSPLPVHHSGPAPAHCMPTTFCTHCDKQTRSWKFPKPSPGGSTSLIENRGSISVEQRHFHPSSFKHKSCYIAWRCLIFWTVSRITSTLPFPWFPLWNEDDPDRILCLGREAASAHCLERPEPAGGCLWAGGKSVPSAGTAPSCWQSRHNPCSSESVEGDCW